MGVPRAPLGTASRRSLARCFLFGSRDLWFEVPLPFFLRDAVHGPGLARNLVGAFLAGYIILYGQTQSYTPQLVISPLRQTPPNKYVAVLWALLLIPITLGLGFATTLSPIFNERDVPRMVASLVGGIVVFALVFAVNSSVHSYLVVRYAAGDKVGAARRCSRRDPRHVARARARVCALVCGHSPNTHLANRACRRACAGRDGRGLLLHGMRSLRMRARARARRLMRRPYADLAPMRHPDRHAPARAQANASGRLIGTLSSGALYSYAASTPTLGFGACMFASSCFCLISGLIVALCRDDEAGLRCGPITCFAGVSKAGDDLVAPHELHKARDADQHGVEPSHTA